jgi:hypothetical protein
MTTKGCFKLVVEITVAPRFSSSYHHLLGGNRTTIEFIARTPEFYCVVYTCIDHGSYTTAVQETADV